MTTPIYQVKIRRDAHTTTPVSAALHEIALLQTIFGEENIQKMNGKLLVGEEAEALSETDIVGEREVNAVDEYDRLVSRYGGNEDGLIVEQIYGKKVTKALDKAIEVKKSAKVEPANAGAKK